MKKLLYSLFVMVAMGLVVVSCEKESSDENVVHDKTPEISASGQYSGTWTRIVEGTTDTLIASGSITMQADTAYVTRVSFKSTDLSLDKACNANIAYADKGFVYFNNVETNEMGTPFYGRINSDSINSASFLLKVRVGRKFQYCTFVFEGSKTAAL